MESFTKEVDELLQDMTIVHTPLTKFDPENKTYSVSEIRLLQADVQKLALQATSLNFKLQDFINQIIDSNVALLNNRVVYHETRS